ncbi:MAG: efflux RND transporter periplasmic adaptor subunit [Saprospiraceae bacterium]
MSKQGFLIVGLVLALLAAAGWYLSRGKAESQLADLTTKVKQGPFKIYAVATGELKAKNSVKISGPQGMRAAGIYQTNITDLVTEGTVVEKGGYVATLDRTELQTKLRDAQSQIDLIDTQLEQAKIDTAIELRGLRDELVNSGFAREERTLEVAQSKYEPQMVIRKAEIELERSDRDFGQLKTKYELTQERAVAKIAEIQAKLKQQTDKLQQLNGLSGAFTVNAPADGMVIYARSWNGKITAGSQISSWNPTVAELPDLSEMLSKTYVNEVDISRVQAGQDVRISVDAFPDKSYEGTVVSVANIGESLKGYDAKVFEVNVALLKGDSILRPAMTTGNEILTYTYPEALYIPLEALHRDSIPFVYKNDPAGTFKQEIVVGDLNDDAAVVALGLQENDEVLLTIPENHESLRLDRLTPEARKSALDEVKMLKEKRKKDAQAKIIAASKLDKGSGDDSNSSGSVIIF